MSVALPDSVLFWRRVDVRGPSDCWSWLGSKSDRGYGRFHVKRGGVIRSRQAHRFAYEDRVGPIPAGLQIDHVKARGCVSTLCCNPAHLEPVTNRENSMRGESPSIRIHKSNVCKRGHSMADAYVNKARGGWRHCRTCQLLRSKGLL